MIDECNHKWDYDSLVLDFGKYGIHRRRCMECGVLQESDPMTNKWPSEDAITDKQSEPELLSAERIRISNLISMAHFFIEAHPDCDKGTVFSNQADAILKLIESIIIPARIAEERQKLLTEIDGLLVKWLALNKLVIKYGDTSTNWHFVAPWGFSEFIEQSLKHGGK